MEVRIKICRADVAVPNYQTDGAVGFDFACAETQTIASHQTALITTGLIIKIPSGYMLLITARSSLAKKKGLMLANGVGTIDQDYCGETDEIYISVYNFSDKDVTLDKGERIANGLFIPIARAEWKQVTHMSETSRGGFGSTDI